jgi:hypothetical protein
VSPRPSPFPALRCCPANSSMLWLAAAAMALQQQQTEASATGADDPIIVPAWNLSFPHQQQFCFSAPHPPPGPPPNPSPPPTPGPACDPSKHQRCPGGKPCPSSGRCPSHHHPQRHQPVNDRLVWLSLPEGDPPVGGWPVWVSLVTDSFGADPRYGNAPGIVCDSHNRGGDGADSQPVGGSWGPDKGFYPFTLPALANISISGAWNYDQEAGAMWNQRLKQYMVANGIAVLCVNPVSIDSWDAGPWYWGPGVDRPYLSALFAHLKTGAKGPLNLQKITVRGYSSGAQMVSWLFEVQANPRYTWNKEFPGVTSRGGVLMSGGTYQCYSDPQDPQYPAQPIGSCKGCTSPSPGFCSPANADGFNATKCSTCDTSVTPYCGQCCPRNYTEAWFEDDHTRYARHPAVLLAQASLSDNHADLCASRNYYEALEAHNVPNCKRVLMTREQQRCFCVGDKDDPASVGSPTRGLCDDPDFGNVTRCAARGNGNAPNCCISHTLGFAGAVLPATKWAIRVLKGD